MGKSGRPVSYIFQNEMIGMYLAGYSVGEIAKIFNIKPVSLFFYFRKLGFRKIDKLTEQEIKEIKRKAKEYKNVDLLIWEYKITRKGLYRILGITQKKPKMVEESTFIYWFYLIKNYSKKLVYSKTKDLKLNNLDRNWLWLADTLVKIKTLYDKNIIKEDLK